MTGDAVVRGARPDLRAFLVTLTVLGAPQTLMAQAGSSCPLPLNRQLQAMHAFGEMMPVFRHARCVNCHGGLDPMSENHRGADQVEANTDFQAFVAQCQACHDGLPGWRVPGEPLFFVDKSDEQLCLQMKRFEPTGEEFVDHIARDHGAIQFIAAAFAGDRALGEQGLKDYDLMLEKPPGSQAELAANAQDWVRILGDGYQSSQECGCVMRLEGTFSQTEEASGAAAAIGTVGQNVTVKGRLVWTRAEGQASFADTRSLYFRPSGGELTVDYQSTGVGIVGGRCEISGRKVFEVEALPQTALQYLWLEIAEDGRYKLSLGMSSRHLLMDAESVCTIAGRTIREPAPVNSVAIEIGVQEGTLADDGISGRLTPPIRRGPLTVHGEWSFTQATD